MEKSASIISKNHKTINLIWITLFLIFVITIISNSILKKSKSKTINQYYQSYNYILEGFSQALNYCFLNYQSSLDLIDTKDFQSKTSDDIMRSLESAYSNTNPDFRKLFYILPDCTVLFSDYHIDDYSDALDFEVLKNIQHKYFVSELIHARGSDEFLFNIILPVKNYNGQIIGALGASVNAERLIKVFQSIKLGELGSIGLIDSKGFFIIHKDSKMIGQKFSPPSTKYEHITSEYLINQSDGYIVTENSDGEEIDLFYKKNESTNWTLLVGTSHKRIEDIYNDYSNTNTVLISLFLLCFIILAIQSILIIHHYTQKKLITVDIDPLTNLMTRARFEIEAEKLIKKYPKNKFMLMECDIRGFKFVNQNYGGQQADNLLIYFSKIINEIATARDGLAGRGFADHFYLFFKVSSIHRAVAEFKQESEIHNEQIKNYEISFFPKFGISFLLPEGEEPRKTIQEMIGQASFAKSTIKDNMLTQYALYNSHLLEKVNRERFIEAHMEAALDNEEFFVLYQPKIELLTEKVVGAEALVRWNSPKLGVLKPDEFIPLFERNGFIKKLDFYVYKKVFKFLNRLLSENNKVVPISVNMSRNHSKPEKFMHDFLALFKQFNIPSNLIEIEILERSVMGGNTLKTFAQLLHQEGFTVAMDDFGSGESSLNMLSQIPVDVLKFDRTFLDSSTDETGNINSDSANFLQTLIDLSKNLRKQTIFEGVETKAQIDFLKGIDCDQVQGFFFSKPLTEIDFIEYLKDHS